MECASPVVAAAATKPRFGSPDSYTPKYLAEKILTSKSALEGEHKLVTVLFCDIVNSTPVAERIGAEAMHTVLNRFFEVALAEVHRYEGTINQFLGDGFMALFGAPVAHEDHARRAVLAALGIQRAIAERQADFGAQVGALTIRMGLNTGPVVVGTIGDNLRMDYTAIGETTNLAARLQQQAEPGSIYISGHTHRLVRTHVDCDRLGERPVKGKVEPVTVYRLRAMRRLAGTAWRIGPEGRAIPLVGRAAELAALRNAVEPILVGSGGVVTVSGDAGLGKSRLVAEVRREFEASDLRWLEGRALSFGRTMSYWPILEILRAAARIEEDDPETEAWVKLARRVRTLLSDEAHEVLPYLATLLGLEVREGLDERVRYLDARAIGRQIFRSARRFIERLAQEGPLVLALEDWHWADESSAALVEHLVPVTETAPLVICVVTRPDPDSPARRLAELAGQRRPGRCINVALAPLPATETTALASHLLGGGDLPAGLRDLVLRKSEGNPFFVEEVVGSLIAMGAISRDDGKEGWRMRTPVEGIVLPETIHGLIMARVDRLDADLKETLKLAAVIGRSFFHRILHSIADSDPALDDRLAELQQLGLIRERRRLPDVEYVFKHALLQEAIYDSILADRRRLLHRRVAESIERLFADRLSDFHPVLAHHYARAEEWEKAQACLFRAGDQASRVAADSEALIHYEQAVEAYTRAFGHRHDLVEQAVLARKMGEALFRRGEHQRAVDFLHRGLAHLGAPAPATRRALRAQIVRQALRQLVHRVWPGSLKGRGSAAAATAVAERLRLYMTLLRIDYFVDQERMLFGVLAGLNLTERANFGPGTVALSMGLGVICDVMGLGALASGYHERALRIAEQGRDPISLAWAHHGLAFHAFYRGTWNGALAHFRRGAELYRGAGDVWGWAALTDFIGGLWCWRGQFGVAHEHAREMVRTGQDAGDAHAEAWGRQLQGLAECFRGPLDAASMHLEEAVRLFKAVPARPSVAETMGCLGYCTLRRGREREALTALEACRDYIAEFRLKGHEVTWPLVGLAETYLRLAESAEGAARADMFESAGNVCRRAQKQSKCFRGGLPRALRLGGTHAWLTGKRNAAHRRWARSLAVADELGSPYERAMTMIEMGRRLEVAAHLDQAVALLEGLGAKVDLGMAHRLVADLAAQNNSADLAGARYSSSIALLSEVKAEGELALAYAGYGRLHRQQGRIAEARDCLTLALEIFDRLGALQEPDRVRAELAALRER